MNKTKQTNPCMMVLMWWLTMLLTQLHALPCFVWCAAKFSEIKTLYGLSF